MNQSLLSINRGEVIGKWLTLCLGTSYRRSLSWLDIEKCTEMSISANIVVNIIQAPTGSRSEKYQYLIALLEDNTVCRVGTQIGLGKTGILLFYLYWEWVDPKKYQRRLNDLTRPQYIVTPPHPHSENRVVPPTPHPITEEIRYFCPFCYSSVSSAENQCPYCHVRFDPLPPIAQP